MPLTPSNTPVQRARSARRAVTTVLWFLGTTHAKALAQAKGNLKPALWRVICGR